MIRTNVLTPEECSSIIKHIPPDAPPILQISTSPEWAAWDKRIFEVIHDSLRAYITPYEYEADNMRDSGYRLVRLSTLNDTQGPLVMPHEGAILFVAVLLNDDVAGGEWWFPFQPAQKEVTPRCGTLLMYPNLFTHKWGIRKVRLGTMQFMWTTLYKARPQQQQ